jgi:CMP-N-acetylneuraminic acid synthetase
LDVPANGACTLVRKKILEEIGGYREDLGAQDGFDLWTKVSRQHKCANVNLPLFFYRRHGANLTENVGRILSARRVIKQDACTIDLARQRPIIAVIPCRKHYDIYPDFWSKKLNGKTLLDIAIESCLLSKVFDKVVVTSDNPAVRKNMARFKDERLCFVERSKSSTLNSRSVVETLEHVTRTLGMEGEGITVLSYIQAPFTTVASLEEALYTLLLNNADSAFAVEEMQEVLYKRAPHGLLPITPQGGIKSDFDVVYAGAPTATASKNVNFKTGSLTGARISHFVIPKEEAFFIRTKRDYEIAKLLGRIKK